MKKINPILKEVLIKVNPSEKDLSSISKFLKNFISDMNKELKKKKIDAEVFVGGSFAKKTLIKKGKYDVDIFVRFNKKYGNEISELTSKILKQTNMHFSNSFLISSHFVRSLILAIFWNGFTWWNDKAALHLAYPHNMHLLPL